MDPLNLVPHTFSSSIEMHVVLHFHSLDLEGVSVLKPVVRDLHLVAVHDFLLEDTVVVPDAVPPRRVF